MIQHLKKSEIDILRWNQCIHKAINNKVYGYSWYLDIVCPGWEALVEGDYKAVMPLPVKKKFGFTYLVQPKLCQQLGVFYTKNDCNISDFYNILFTKYFYVNVCVPESQGTSKFKYSILIRNNYILDLNTGYEVINSGYSRNHHNNLKKANKSHLEIRECDRGVSIGFLEKEYFKLLKTPKYEFEIYHQLLTEIDKQWLVNSYGVYKDDKLLATLCCSIVNNNVNIMSIASAEGKRENALYFLIDHLIHKLAKQDFHFDFGGSNIQSVAYFFKGFGPALIPFQQIQYSKIPDFLFKPALSVIKLLKG
jgi:hypothetical protein